MSAPGPLAAQPVLTAATLSGAVTALLALVVAFGADLTSEQTAAILGVVAVAGPIVAAFIARTQVTPLVRPRSARGDVLAEVGVNEGPPPRQVDYSADPKLDAAMNPRSDVPEVRERSPQGD